MYSSDRNLELVAIDMLAQGASDEDVRRHIKLLEESSLAYHPAWQLRQRMEDIAAGRIRRVHWPWHNLDMQCPSLMPGQITVLAGAPGATKSFALLQCLDYWVSCDIPVAMYALEGKRSSHLTRLLAQMETNANIMDVEWVVDNAESVREAMDRHSDHIESVGRCICVPDESHPSVTYNDVIAWMRDRARVGDRVLIIDPVTSADPVARQWDADRELINQCIRLSNKFKLSIILVTHPAKTASQLPSLDSLALGASFSRHSDAVLWLSAIDYTKRSVRGVGGIKELVECNRVMFLLKVRDGRGQGKAIAYRFGLDTLRLAEQGIILKEPK